MAAQFDFQAQELRGCGIARPSGEIDMSNAGELRSRLVEMVERGDVVIDLSHVTFLDSTALGAMIVAYHRGQEVGHSVRLAAAQGPVRKVLEITQLDIALEHHDDVGDAVETALGAAGANGMS